MDLRALKLITFLLCVSFQAWATKAPQKNDIAPPQVPVKEESNVDKETWIKNMNDKLPVVLCKKEQYFMSCFDVTETDCLDFTKLVVSACINNIKLALPLQVDVQQGEHWGQLVGRCTYDLYEKFMQPRKQKKSECYAVSAPQKDDKSKDDKSKPAKANP
jgi:hypothetical protein